MSQRTRLLLPLTQQEPSLEPTSIDRYAADSSCQPDVQFEEAQLRKVLREAYEGLSLTEKKLLRMKGLELRAIESMGA
jgi:hypothetical protein